MSSDPALREQTLQPTQKVVAEFDHFARSELSGSIALLVAALIALIWANSPWSDQYFGLLETELGLTLGNRSFSLTLHHWINDGLMVLFFLNIGLEMKREFLVGELASWQQAILPLSAALGGMIVPACIYLLFNGSTEASRGWGVPIATDIAFALGILALLRSRVPRRLKIFVTAFAVADDLGAVLIIAFFYTDAIRWSALLAAVGLLLAMAGLSYIYIRRTEIYLVLGVFTWVLILLAGLHGTVAGVLIALVVPAKIRINPRIYVKRQEALIEELNEVRLTDDSLLTDRDQLDVIAQLRSLSRALEPPLIYIKHYLSPLVNLLVLPLFALFNAGVDLQSGLSETVLTPVSLGIICGLVIGKQAGIMGATWLIVRFGPARLPERVDWKQIYGVSWLAGIGFTMSLFITDLGFARAAYIQQAKIGILIASVIAGLAGAGLLWIVSKPQAAYHPPDL